MTELNSTSQRILLVDDDELILFAMKEYLKPFGYQIDCAREKEEAQAMIANISYRAVLVDVRLTGLDGIEGLEVISFVKERSPWTRIIVLTGYGSPEIETDAMQHGADVFLHKPMRMREVSEILQGLLTR